MKDNPWAVWIPVAGDGHPELTRVSPCEFDTLEYAIDELNRQGKIYVAPVAINANTGKIVPLVCRGRYDIE